MSEKEADKIQKVRLLLSAHQLFEKRRFAALAKRLFENAAI
jgi:hypothetical protein